VSLSITESEKYEETQGISKKKIEILEPALSELHERMVKQGVKEAVAKKICDDIRPFAGYAFNRSHAAAYAYIAYQTAYFKTYYPIEFMTALLTVFFDKEDRVANYIKDAKEMGIKVLPPDINVSNKGFSIHGDDIRFGLGTIKGLGDAALAGIFEHRPFKSLADMIERVPKRSLNKTNVTALAESGALDNLMEEFDNRMEGLQEIYRLRGDDDDLKWDIKAYTPKIKLEKEKARLGIFVSGHPLERHAQNVSWDHLQDNEVVETAGIVIDFREIFTKREEWMAVVNFETLEGPRRMVIFPDTYKKIQGQLATDLIVKLKVYMKTNYMRNERDIVVKDVAIPKRVNKEVLAKQAVINSDSPTESLEEALTLPQNIVPF